MEPAVYGDMLREAVIALVFVFYLVFRLFFLLGPLTEIIFFVMEQADVVFALMRRFVDIINRNTQGFF